MKKWFWLAALLLLIPLAARAETVSVSPGGLGEALAACADGDIIELADGVYAEPDETFPLTVTRAVTLRAAPGANPVIRPPRLQAGIRVEADSVTLQGLEIRFLRTGIYAIGSGMTVENCRIILADESCRVSSCGMWCGGVYRMTLRDCAFTGCSVALAGPPLSERSENVPKLTGLFEVGEDPAFFTSHTIEDCTVNGKPLYYAASLPSVTVTEEAGEIICCGCGEVTVRDIALSDASMGMVLAYNERITVENCRADRCGVFGIYAAKCGGGLISLCAAEGTNHAIDVRACRNITLRDCGADACEQGMFFSAVTGSVMDGCVVSDTRQGYFIGYGSGNTLTGCTASGCENGFHPEVEDNLQMIGCAAEKCTSCGIRLDRSPAALDGCTLRENWVAVMAYGGAPLDLTDNRFTGNENCSLYLRDIGFSHMTGNIFEKSGQYSLIARGSMGGSIWSGNTLDVPADLSGISDGFARMD